MPHDRTPQGLDSPDTSRLELLRLVRVQAERAHVRDGLDSIDDLRKRFYATMIRASSRGVIPRDVDLQAAADLITGAVWSRVVHGDHLSEARAAAVVEAILPRPA